ncbi:MAG TPA: alpha/beta hydrolase [Polyangiaceae bacterium]|nr:alpha/beta hydrolase [Polyangiaceae bacterium]
MTDLYDASTVLTLRTGSQVQAFRTPVGANGARPKCLLLHGNPGSILNWERLVPKLAAFADVVAIDSPGFGRSMRRDSSAAGLHIERFADEAIAVADACSWSEPFFIVGHSHGGGVAQVAAAKYPHRVAGIVPIASLGAPAHGGYRLLMRPGVETVLRVLGAVFRSPLFRPFRRSLLRASLRDVFSPAQVPEDRLDREVAALVSRPEIMMSMVHAASGAPCDLLDAGAASIRCPVTWVHGDHDALVPEKYPRRVHERILAARGSSEFVLLRDAGHMLLDSHADELCQRILAMVVAK